LFLQALPLVTVVVGDAKILPGLNRVWTLSPQAEEPNEIEFPAHPVPGKPSWSNYVKGVVSNFTIGMSMQYIFFP
jgi:hypothetical protein